LRQKACQRLGPENVEGEKRSDDNFDRGGDQPTAQFFSKKSRRLKKKLVSVFAPREAATEMKNS
jgi:hypothetical protein